MSALLEVRGLEAGYGSSQVLFGVDLDVDQGEMVTLLGRNGMGKTTTLLALFSRVDVKAGTVRWRGESIRGASPQAVAHRGVALVPEGRHVFPNLTVRENLVAFADRNGAREPWTLDRVLAFFPQLVPGASRLAGRLSGGEQQMLAIGRALMRNPALLVLDEATEGLAPTVREEVWACLAALRAAGQTLLVVDKHVERLMALADRHVVLERGRVAWAGASADFAADPGLRQRLLGV